jgi:membrane-bound lytic murein transglycosylase D
MDGRTSICCGISVLAAVILAPGCSVSQQSRFQMSFLPPAPRGAAIELPEPPPPEPNLYLGADLPAVIVANSQSVLQRRTQGDATVQTAQRRFQNGKRLYQAGDLAAARAEFDRAVDLMLEASDQGLIDRQQYDRQLDEMVDSIHRFDLADLGAAAPLEQDKFEKAPLEDILQMTFPVDPKLKDKVREQVAATTSQLPLTVNDTVLGYINYFSNRGRRTLLYGLQRSGRYRPMIQRVLDEEGVPQELIHLAQAESGFFPRAMSRAAAGGMWQFVKFRGQEYGLKQAAYTDDRFDPEKATRAAARHLKDLYHEFGDWYLAIAAYNCGPVNVEKAVERTGSADFFELRDRGVLPRETTNYVPIILAMTIMEKNAAEYGIQGFQLDPPLEYDTIESSAPTSLTLVADILDMPVTEIAALNPASLKGMVPAEYPIHVPKGTGNTLVAALQMIPSNHLDAWRMHRVGAGETLASISKRYSVATATIVSANRLETPQAQEGDRLLIPSAQRIQLQMPGKIPTAASARNRSSRSRSKSSRSARVVSASSRTSRKTNVTVAHNTGN